MIPYAWTTILNLALVANVGVMIWAGWHKNRQLWFRHALALVGFTLLNLTVDVMDGLWAFIGFQLFALAMCLGMLHIAARFYRKIDTAKLAEQVDDVWRDNG